MSFDFPWIISSTRGDATRIRKPAFNLLDAQMQMDTGRYSSVTVSFGTCKSRSPNLGMIASEEEKKQLTWSIQFRHGQLRHVQIPVS
ncbi:hypothetical protein PGTUg99_027675 [Puccinia graminis f. sp. tritici]|uniref:Uncharacterized protein n=1 Tax=Puccinia graminis f. sp. tritici TaxID=56615 RepID=A0A5B0PPP4_PUCGR|nr:hypothetical protein PGTUg99_027675 [Puccinia graminis f. sp. tritici]